MPSLRAEGLRGKPPVVSRGTQRALACPPRCWQWGRVNMQAAAATAAALAAPPIVSPISLPAADAVPEFSRDACSRLLAACGTPVVLPPARRRQASLPALPRPCPSGPDARPLAGHSRGARNGALRGRKETLPPGRRRTWAKLQPGRLPLPAARSTTSMAHIEPSGGRRSGADSELRISSGSCRDRCLPNVKAGAAAWWLRACVLCRFRPPVAAVASILPTRLPRASTGTTHPPVQVSRSRTTR